MPDETTGQDRPRMRPGMPLAERQQLRSMILDKALDLARQQAADAHLSTRCRGHLEFRATTMSYDQRRAEHVKCQGESMGTGCLCVWHDAEIEPVPDVPTDQEPAG
jgi:hypothetical protein